MAIAVKGNKFTIQHVSESGWFLHLTSDLEFTAGWSAGSGTGFWLLQATAEDDTFLIISAFSAEMFYCRCGL